ncbi:LANO_0C01442g1_1 [Lachancea nothofagi CBS 11611]|uniref:LANO_0C01442g1_1 n=1 Tax=Lachancea nothofagi CBS 11611 TaxID=1266666 RepID=A0A1G4J437_9SACH|nr:LANO_0C01442g1_1 [Lachancea nothofagi CBS 11611]
MDVTNVETLLRVIRDGVCRLEATPQVMAAIDQFQQDPSVLEDHLADFVRTLTGKFFDQIPQAQQTVANIFYTLSKVCGVKRTMKHLSTDIFLLPKILSHIDTLSDTKNWKILMLLLSWLRMVLMSPFKLENDMAIFDMTNKLKTSPVLKPLVAGVHAELFAKNLPLFKDHYAKEGIDLLSLNYTLKAVLIHTKSRTPETFLDSSTLKELTETCLNTESELSEARVGLLLKVLPKLCRLHAEQESWEQIEEITTWFLNNVALSFTELRFQLAHSFAKIVQLLVNIDPASASSLVESILQEVKEELENNPINAVDTDKLHSELLFIAEVARIGALDSSSINEFSQNILPITIKFQQLRLNKITGHQIRDATNFICWSIVRNCDVILNLETIFINLLLCSMFDHELTIRRSASAALQEVLGRYGVTLLDSASVMKLIELPISSLDVSFQKNVSELISVFQESAPRYVKPLIDWLILDNVFKNLNFRIVELSASSISQLIKSEGSKRLEDNLLQPIFQVAKVLNTVENDYMKARFLYLTTQPYLFHIDLVRKSCLQCFNSIASNINERSRNLQEVFKIKSFMKTLNMLATEEEKLLQIINSTMIDALFRVVRFCSPSDSGFGQIKEWFLPIVTVMFSREPHSSTAVISQLFEENFNQLVKYNNPLCSAGLAYTPPARFSDSLLKVCPRMDCEARCQVIEALSDKLPTIVESQGEQVLELILGFLDDYTLTDRGDVGGIVRKCTATLIEKQFPFFMEFNPRLKKEVTSKFLRLIAEPTDKLRETCFRVLARAYNFKVSQEASHDENVFQFYSAHKQKFGDELWQGYVFSSGAIYSTDQQIASSIDCFLNFYDELPAEEKCVLLKDLMRVTPAYSELKSWQQSTSHVNRLGCQKRDIMKQAIVCVNFWRRALESGMYLPSDFSLKGAYAKFYNLHLLRNTALKSAVLKLFPFIAVSCKAAHSNENDQLKNDILNRLQQLAKRANGETNGLTQLQTVCREGMAIIYLAFDEIDKLEELKRFTSSQPVYLEVARRKVTI